MLTRFLLPMAFVGILACATAAAADPGQPAVWVSRELRFLGPDYLSPEVRNSGEPLQLTPTTNEQLYDQVAFVLRQLGARDVYRDMRGCWQVGTRPCVAMTFKVLAPNGTSGSTAESPLQARWAPVQMGGDCALLQEATRTVVPLFSSRNIKLIPIATCEKIHVGLRADVLKPLQEEVVSR
jgi:hypothetical protein